jgi:hypothetical protein
VETLRLEGGIIGMRAVTLLARPHRRLLTPRKTRELLVARELVIMIWIWLLRFVLSIIRGGSEY